MKKSIEEMAQDLMNLAPKDWEKTIDAIPEKERDSLRRELEGISERSGALSGYLEERHGSGCGDQGHEKAMKKAMRNGKMIWMKVFGFNGYWRS